MTDQLDAGLLSAVKGQIQKPEETSSSSASTDEPRIVLEQREEIESLRAEIEEASAASTGETRKRVSSGANVVTAEASPITRRGSVGTGRRRFFAHAPSSLVSSVASSSAGAASSSAGAASSAARHPGARAVPCANQ